MKRLSRLIPLAALLCNGASADTIFTESFETPAVTGSVAAGDVALGAVTFDNDATAAGTINGSGAVARVVDGLSAGLDTAASDGDQAIVYGFGGAVDTSLTWQIAAGNTLVQGSTLTISYDVASMFNPGTGESWDIVLTGGAEATFSASLSGTDTVDVWRQDQFMTTVTDSTQPVVLQIVGTRGASGSDDFAFDHIVVEGSFSGGIPLILSDTEVDEFSISETGADVSATLANGPADVTLYWAATDYGTNLTDWQTNGASSSLGSQTDGTVSGSLSGLTGDSVYVCRFYAVDTPADPDRVAWSGPVTVATLFPEGKMITDLEVAETTYNRVELSWTDSFNTEEGYDVDRSDDGGPFFAIAYLAADSTGYIDTTVDPETTYEYRIRAYSFASGESDWSASVEAVTPAAPPFTPSVTSDFDFEDNLVPAVFDTIPYGSGPTGSGGSLSFDGTTAIQAPTAAIYGGTAPSDNFCYEVIITPSALDAFDIAAGLVDDGGANSGSFLFQGSNVYSMIECGEAGAPGTTVPGVGTTVALAFVMEEGTARLFVNGVEETSRAFSADGPTPIDTATLEAVVVGGNLFDGAVGAFNGSIDRFRAFTFIGPFEPSYLLTVAPVGDYVTWIGGFEVDGLTGFDDDFDLDGLGNGIENFFGTDPGVWNDGVVIVSHDAPGVTFQHPQNATPASDVTATYEWSLDLATWNTSGASIDGTTVTITPSENTPVSGVTTVTAAVSGTDPSRLFFRVNVQQIAP